MDGHRTKWWDPMGCPECGATNRDATQPTLCEVCHRKRVEVMHENLDKHNGTPTPWCRGQPYRCFITDYYTTVTHYPSTHFRGIWENSWDNIIRTIEGR